MVVISKRAALLTSGLFVGGLGLGLLLAPSADAAPRPGQFCSPHGAIYTTTAKGSLLCAQTPSDKRWRWRAVVTTRPVAVGPGTVCPVGTKLVQTRVTATDRKAYTTYICGRPVPSPGSTTTSPTTTTTKTTTTTTTPPTTTPPSSTPPTTTTTTTTEPPTTTTPVTP